MDKKESRTLRLHFYDFKHLPIQEPLRLFNNLNRLTLTRMKNVYLSLFALMLVASSFAQSSFGPVDSGTLTYVGKTIPLRDMPTMEVTDSDELKIIPNRTQNIPKANPAALPLDGDPLAKNNRAPFRASRELLLDFQGMNRSNSGGATPPDPTGAVGPDHYVHAVNVALRIFDKEGNSIVGPVFLGTFFGDGNNSGDPIVLYDQLADRWFISQFRIGTSLIYIAISDTPDPTGEYTIYSFNTGSFPDYPHYSIWHNAYVLTANKGGQTTYVLDRETMIAGDPDPGFLGFTMPGLIRRPNYVFGSGPVNLLGTNFDPAAPAYIVYMQDDGWTGAITEDHLKIWEIDIDWENPGDSTISSPAIIPTEPFDSTFFAFGQGDVRQPGTTQRLDNIGSIVSYMANYRSFPDHNSLLVNFNVDLGSQRSGIRWYELRNVDNGPWSIFQEGTHDLDDGEGRFMGSMAMDSNGNIGLAYHLGSENTPVGIRFSGRMADDPLGEMTLTETIVHPGSGIQTNTNRFGDYSHLTLDPVDDTFWGTFEYLPSNNFWGTRVFTFNLEDDLGIADRQDALAELEVLPLSGDRYEILVTATRDLGDLSFELYDINGRQILMGDLQSSSNLYRYTVSSSSLSSGIYIVRVAGGQFEQSKKFVIR